MDWVSSINTWLQEQVHLYGAKSLFLPAGETPRPLYENWELTRPKFLSGLRLLQVDDIASGPQSQLFQNFFKKELPSYTGQMDFIEHGERSADITILGLGTNGHVAFHEPRLAREFYSGCLRLDADTTRRLDLPSGTWGVSYGLGAFMRSKAIALIVRGQSKKPILNEVLSAGCELPAAELKRHPHFSVFAV